MLARAGFGDDAVFAHAFGEQNLPHAMIDLVRAGMVQLFALEINFRAAEIFRSGAGRKTAATAGRHNV